MVHFKVSAVLPLPANIFFVERDSAAFRSLVAKVMKLGGLEILDGWMDGQVEVYKFVTKPDIDKFVPKKLQHYIPGGELSFVDIIEYDPKRLAGSPYRLHVTSIPPIFPKQAHIECQLTIEEETKDTCRQTLEGDVDIHIFGLGKIAEGIIADNLKKVYSGIPAIVERWVEFRNQVLQQPNGQAVLVSGRPDNYDIAWISDQIEQLISGPLKPAYELENAPGLTQKLGQGKTAKDAEAAMRGSGHSKPESRGFDGRHNRGVDVSQRNITGVPAASSSTAEENGHAASPSPRAADAEAGSPKNVQPFPRSAHRLTESPVERSEASRTTMARDLASAGGYGPPEGLVRDSMSGQAFYDASEDWPWMEDEPLAWDPDSATGEQITQDHMAATEWYRSFKKSRKNLEPLSLDPANSTAARDGDARTSRPPGAERVSKRFNPAYQEQYRQWQGYWEGQEVPQQEDVPDIRARLGHLFGLGAAWGLLKPGRGRHGHRRSGSGIPSLPDSASGSSLPDDGSSLQAESISPAGSRSSATPKPSGGLVKQGSGSSGHRQSSEGGVKAQKGGRFGKMFSCFAPRPGAPPVQE